MSILWLEQRRDVRLIWLASISRRQPIFIIACAKLSSWQPAKKPRSQVKSKSMKAILVACVKANAGRGAPWRDLPEKYGNWNSVYRRDLRWRDLGVWKSVLVALTDALENDTSYSMNSTVVRGHVQAAPVLPHGRRSGGLQSV